MKKLLLVLAIGAFVACNDNASDMDSTDDTVSTSTIDSAAVTPVDTTGMGTDTTGVGADTSANK